MLTACADCWGGVEHMDNADAATPVDAAIATDAAIPADAAMSADALTSADVTTATDATTPLDATTPSDAASHVDATPSAESAAPDVTLTLTCADLAVATPAQQVTIVEADLECVDDFVSALLADPWTYLEAFYALIGSDAATDELWSVVYEELRLDRFRFAIDVVDDLYQNLPAAIATCDGEYRCDDWTEWILPGLYDGSMFLCPETAGLSEQALLQALPHGDYYCTEAIAQALAPLADTDTISALLAMATGHAQGWSRRNALRVIGRFAERGQGEAAGALVLVTRADDVKAALLDRVENDREEDVLHDALWVLDSFFHPCWELLPLAEALSLDSGFSSSLRFRAAAVVSRLFQRREGVLPQGDVDYLLSALVTDDSWVRAEAAYTIESLDDDQLDAGIEAQLIAALEAAWAVEDALHAQVYIARALDRFNGDTAMQDQLLVDYEAAHLGNTASGEGILIRSGLPQGELAAFVDLMQDERAAYFDLLRAPFDTPVAGDTNDSMTLFLFATQEEYQEYMSAFVGFAAYAGGLYLEADGRLYTYQRTPQQSVYTVEQLIQHEYGHYLQARHLFPGIWGDSGYHDQPKAWADEGMAEVMGGLSFDGGGYTVQLRSEHLSRICGTTYRSLDGLLSQRAGYDENGTFDYSGGWAFSHYMITERSAELLAIYAAYRDESYALASFASIAGVASVSALEADWHAAVDGWCASGPPGPSGPGTGDSTVSAGDGVWTALDIEVTLAEPALRVGRLDQSPRPSPPWVR